MPLKGVGDAMKEFNAGTLNSGSPTGPKVTSRKQAIAIGLNSARKAGAKVPSPPRRMSGGRR